MCNIDESEHTFPIFEHTEASILPDYALTEQVRKVLGEPDANPAPSAAAGGSAAAAAAPGSTTAALDAAASTSTAIKKGR